ncbi:MAG: hypothetical protein ABSF12_10140 [Bryobacteraceae bacterium]
MRVAMNHSLAASRKEPLAELTGRIRQAFLDAGLPEPAIRFTLAGEGRVEGHSPIDRVLKRHPEMKRFETFIAPIPGSSESRRLTNAASGEPAEYSTLLAIAAGVPRSYPISLVVLHFHAPAFGERLIGLPKFGHSLPGVMVTDNRWVSGRHRALSVYTVVEVEGDKKLPPNPESVDAVIKACGKVRRTDQVHILASDGRTIVGSIPPANLEAVNAIVAAYRARIKEVVELAGLPHDLPPAAETRLQNAGVIAGPRKPALETAFKPMGYGCRGGSGEFHLTRRTSGNLTIELYLDVGTWSHTVSAIFLVQGAGFKASLGIPVAPRDAAFGQYPIGDASQWQRIVENLAAMVRELDRSFVPEIEQAAGPTPAWYQPTS